MPSEKPNQAGFIYVMCTSAQRAIIFNTERDTIPLYRAAVVANFLPQPAIWGSKGRCQIDHQGRINFFFLLKSP